VQQEEFFARHDPELLPRLRQARIGIAGAGGLGSNVACCLARAGIGQLIFADFDVVEPSNLNRQQYFLEQIGQAKVDALQENLRRINPFSIYEAHRVRLDAENIPRLFEEVDIMVEAFDCPAMKAVLVDVWVALWPQRPIIVGSGMGGFGGNNDIRCQRLFGQVYLCGDGCTDCDDRLPMAPRVTIVAAMQANLVLELLAGKASIS